MDRSGGPSVVGPRAAASRHGCLAVATLGCALAAVCLGAPSASSSAPLRRVTPPLTQEDAARTDPVATILVYHRFGPVVADAMTVRTATLQWQLSYLAEHHYSVIPLGTLVSYLLGRAPSPPFRSVVITADDGHQSVFTEMLAAIREYKFPVTLFIYPSAISNAPYAMSWDELDALHRTGLFDVQSHTYWHPNFKIEQRRLSSTAYQAFVRTQFAKARAVLRDRVGVDANLIAWPFGIYDDNLIEMAREGGYIAGFTLDRRFVTRNDDVMKLPRFLMTDSATGATFTAMLPREDP